MQKETWNTKRKQPEGRVKDKTIDKILEKDDLELGLDVLAGQASTVSQS